MSVLSRRPVLRWLVPAFLALVLASAGSVAGVMSASAGEKLAPRSAAQLLVDVQKARLAGLSGTVVQTADLGLPSLAGLGGGSGGDSSDLSSLVSGSHTLRVWYAGPDKARLALMGSLGESDVVRNGTDLWVWSSKDRTATHRTVPASSGTTPRSLGSGATTPQQAADMALAAISPSTKVSTDGTATVAKRSAYELVLQPKDAGSLVASVRIAVDGATRVPTRVQVFARGQSSPSFEVGFTAFDPTAPAASVFTFNPPPGTKVTEGSAVPRGHGARGDHTRGGSGGTTTGSPRVVGQGWASVLVTKVPTAAAGSSAGGDASLTRALSALPRVSGSWGSGHVLRGTLFTAVLTDDGRLAVGAVAPGSVYAALAGR